MASSQDDDDDWDEWDKSTSEIQSEDSDELFENRPNRWRGPPQSWRTITEEDRLTYNASERLRNQDLSVHLYNAFALRQAPQEAGAGAGSDIDAGTDRPVVHREPWAPPKGWTSWPLGTHLLPPDDFMKKTEDEDEVFTFRRLERDTPSGKLEEVVSANILRFAKEKFSKRRLGETPPSSAGVKVKAEPLSSENESLPSEAESEDGRGKDLDGASDQWTIRTPVKTFKPAVATDDDISYELIRPSARGILEQLDQTLSILHNSRMTSAKNLMDSGESSSEDDEHEEELHRSRHTSRASSGRARSRSMPRISTNGGGEPTTTTEAKKSNRGRPAKFVQREGESEQDFLIRRARAQKKRLPTTLNGEVGDGEMTAAEGQKSPRKRTRRRTRRRESITEDREYWMQKKLERLNLRDWSDVMGAAALAGFSPKVIDRATQRCANLFGQGMDMHTLHETTISSGLTGIETTRYEPGGAPSSSSGSDHEDEDLDVRQARSISRHSGVVPRRTVSSAPSAGEDEGGEPPRKRQKRSSSRGTAAGQHYCPHADCDRSLKGFGRPFNLKRHLKLVHGGEPVEESKETRSVDEGYLDGGVQRDGFLEPVRIQKGWRAEDTRKRARKRTAWKRQRNESSSEDDDSVSGDSTSGESEAASES